MSSNRQPVAPQSTHQTEDSATSLNKPTDSSRPLLGIHSPSPLSQDPTSRDTEPTSPHLPSSDGSSTPKYPSLTSYTDLSATSKPQPQSPSTQNSAFTSPAPAQHNASLLSDKKGEYPHLTIPQYGSNLNSPSSLDHKISPSNLQEQFLTPTPKYPSPSDDLPLSSPGLDPFGITSPTSITSKEQFTSLLPTTPQKPTITTSATKDQSTSSQIPTTTNTTTTTKDQLASAENPPTNDQSSSPLPTSLQTPTTTTKNQPTSISPQTPLQNSSPTSPTSPPKKPRPTNNHTHLRALLFAITSFIDITRCFRSDERSLRRSPRSKRREKLGPGQDQS